MYLQGPQLGGATKMTGCTAPDSSHLKTKSPVIWQNAKNTPIIYVNSTSHAPGHQHPVSTKRKVFPQRWIRLWIWPDFESIQSSEIRTWTVSFCIANSHYRSERVSGVVILSVMLTILLQTKSCSLFEAFAPDQLVSLASGLLSLFARLHVLRTDNTAGSSLFQPLRTAY